LAGDGAQGVERQGKVHRRPNSVGYPIGSMARYLAALSCRSHLFIDEAIDR
jgi:hypothetical protein